jgi:PAS domain S-box-containing protein
MAGEKRPCILVVDDNPATLYATSRIVQAAGFDVRQAGTGAEALALSPGVDLVVLDVHLPDMDGFRVCRELRARPETARTPVIHLSATFVKDSNKVEGLDAGADGYLTHPVEPPVLIATINAFLRAREAEEAMRASEAKFRAIFDRTPNGIALLSEDLVFLEANPALCRMFGRAHGDVVGKHLSAFMPRGREERAFEISRELQAAGAWHDTTPVIRSDGEQRQLEWNLSIHSVPGVRLAIVTDVTERRAIEAERERLLEGERAARGEAERANRLKDDFLATLGHELRTPLHAIVGWTQILRAAPPTPDDLAEGLAIIDRNARVQTQIIEDLLDMSRIISGKVRLDVQRVDVTGVIRAAVETVRPAADAKGIRVSTVLDPLAGPVSGDPNRLQQVFWNLLSNAVKFTPRGGRVHVTLERVNSQLEVSVTDTGEGVAPSFLPHVFDRFRQADASANRRHGGLGLGLAIVKQLVELHGGTVRVKSPGVGQGATFTVALPLMAVYPEPAGSDADRRHPTAETAPAVLPEEQCVRIADVRVLVVDDEADARGLVRRLLEDCDAVVETVGSAAEAYDRLRGGRFDVLVSDIGMPGEDGYSLLRRVRALPAEQGGRVPAIALTAYARAEDRMKAVLAGFQLHLAKPVEPAELITMVASVSGRTRG